MNKNNEQRRFESRVITGFMDVFAVINHLEDNLDGDKPLQVILTIEPRRFRETDYCSIKEQSTETILVENKKEISNINKLLNEKLFMAHIRIAIE